MSHYFISDPNLKSNLKELEFQYQGVNFKFLSDSGVFSKNEIDDGTITLLNAICKEQLGNSILDLGCGYGTVGVIVKKLNNDLNVDMLDINDKAIALAKNNCDLNNTNNNVFLSDGFLNVNNSYDVIITNPPIRAGKKVIYQMFEDSIKYLNSNGKLYVVMRKSHGAKSAINKLNDIYGNCLMISKNKGFYVFCSKKL